MHHQKNKRNGATCMKMKKVVKASIIDNLPEDLIIEIIAQLVQHSPLPFADLYNLKAACKIFFDLSKDNIIKQRIALEREFSNLNWKATDRRMTILKTCANAGNAEARFILALIIIFEQKDISKGAEYIKEAIQKGHKLALYVMKILHLQLQKHHISIDEFSLDLSKVDGRKLCDDDQFHLYREKALNVIRQVIWNKWYSSGIGNARQCKNSDCGIATGWNGHRNFCSDACQWNFEHIAFCREM